MAPIVSVTRPRSVRRETSPGVRQAAYLTPDHDGGYGYIDNG